MSAAISPSETVELQWATYYDAADQSALSRIYGGIHPWIDDFPARIMGAEIGVRAWEHAQTYFHGATSVPGDVNGDGLVNVDDLLIVLNTWGTCDDCNDCIADITGDCTVNVDDLLIILNNWG